MNTSNPRLRGSPAIAKVLDCSPKTIQRKGRSGELPLRKDGDRTSPWTIDRDDLDRLRRPLLYRDAE
jgi:hypothetical protein